MAVVKIWKVESNLKQVVEYAENKEKTDALKFSDLSTVIDYAVNGDKTEEALYVSGINCDPKRACDEMELIKNKFLKSDGVLAWHAYQSFKEGEVTPDEAHKIGLELANEMWGDKFQVVVTTHLNTKHLHNHFVLNSVSFVDGKKYNADRSSYAEFRRLNDLICIEHNKSYLQEKKTKSGINYLNYQNKNINYSNYYKKAKQDLDLAIRVANNYSEFKTILKNMGYEITVRTNKLSIRGSDYKRNIRIERYFGEDYSIDNINKRISGLYLSEKKNYYRNKKPQESILSILSKRKYNSFYSMYIRYCNILNNYPSYIKKNNISSTIKEDVKRLDILSKQAQLLADNDIDTKEKFVKFYNDKIDTFSDFKCKKLLLHRQYIKSNDDELKKSLDDLSKQILSLKEVIKLCEDINERCETIKTEIKNLEENQLIKKEQVK